MIRRFALPTALLLATLAMLAPSAGAAGRQVVPFEELTMIFELNETDGDAEVVMFVKAPEGMDRLVVFDPTDEKRIEMKARGRDDVGQGQLRLESAEPSIDEVVQAWPEGEYHFFGRTISGLQVVGKVTLSHDLLPAPSFSPDDEEGLDPDHVIVSWTPVPGAAAYQVEIEQDEIGANLTVTLGPDVSSLDIPAGFLLPGTEYEIGVSTITPAGNVSVAESSFTTAD